jgi:hypothetical protein
MNIETSAKKMADVLGEAVVQGAFKKLVQIEVAKCLRQMDRLKKELAPYEKRFEMALEKQHDRLMEINQQ